MKKVNPLSHKRAVQVARGDWDLIGQGDSSTKRFAFAHSEGATNQGAATVWWHKAGYALSCCHGCEVL